VAGTWGGAQRGGGRKKGQTFPRLGLARSHAARKARRIEAIADAKERARAFVKTFEGTLLAKVFSSHDLKLQVEAWRTLKAYARGLAEFRATPD